MKPERLHFLGITGHAMRGVALAARELGYEVTGSDPGAGPPGTEWLDEQGVTWYDTADPGHLKGVDRVIISGHTRTDDPEVREAQRQGIPITSFAQFVGELTKDARTIVVSGTHGKTTITSLITWIFEVAGRNPDYLIGIKPHNFVSSVRLKNSTVAVIEGDEYRASQLDDRSKFAFYHPDVLVITSIEMDHPDFFENIEDITRRFADVVRGLPEDGRLLYAKQVPVDVAKLAGERRELYSGDHRNDRGNTDWHRGKAVKFTPDGLGFSLQRNDDTYGTLEVPLYGKHNILNSIAAAGVALGEGISFDTVAEAMKTFKGAYRRFQCLTAPHAPVRVIDDYAHHPTEVATTIEAAKLHFPGRVLAVFRPHTYSRTKELISEYHGAFKAADVAFIAPIQAAREAHLAGTVSSQDIASQAGPHVAAFDDRTSLLEAMTAAARPGDTVLSMTVDGFDELAPELADRLG